MARKLVVTIILTLQMGWCSNAWTQTAIDSVHRQPVKVGLALSGGGARGIAHIGVIQALEEEGIPIDMIAGTSMGSIVGGLYAAGLSGEQMRHLVQVIDWQRIFSEQPEPGTEFISERYGIMDPIIRLRFKPWKIYIPPGLMNGQHISEELFRYTAAANFAAKANFDSLVVPYRAMAVDAATGEVYALNRGELAQAIRASMAIPMLFYPAIVDNKVMIDGGVINILPTDVVREMGASVVIASDLEKLFPLGEEPENLIDVANHTIDIMIRELKKDKVQMADVLIAPQLGKHSSMSYSGLDSLIEIGYQTTRAKMNEIKRLLPSAAIGKNHAKRQLDYTALNRATIKRIQVMGHDRVRRRLITSEFPLKRGDRFDLGRALCGIKNIYATQLFENVWLELEPLSEHAVDVTIRVIEKYPRTLALGLNYRSDIGLSGFVQIVHFNFLGWGERFMPQFRFGEVYNRLGLEIVNDRFFASPVVIHNALHYEQLRPYRYNDEGERSTQLAINRFVGRISVGLQPHRTLLISVGLRGERVWQEANRTIRIPSLTSQNFRAFFEIHYDNTDSHYFPRRGIFYSLAGETVVAPDANVNPFSKVQFDLSGHHPLPFGQIASLFFKAGWSKNGLPIYEQFRLGGPYDLPGFHIDELWGNHLVLAGVRYRKKIYKRLYFQSSWSAGNTFTQFDDITANALVTGYSVGFVAPTPMGPISALYGKNDTGRKLYHLSIGYDF